MSLQRGCRSVNRRLGRDYSWLERCLSENGPEGVDHCGVFFLEGFEGCGRKRASERFLVDLRKLRAIFLRSSASVGLAGLGFLVGRWRDQRRKIGRSLEGG